MEYETCFEKTRALTNGNITLQFVRYRKRRCEQTEWNSTDAKRLFHLSFQYFKNHGCNEDSGSMSYWVDIHGDGLAIKIEASNTKLLPDRAVHYRMFLRQAADDFKDVRLRNERSNPGTPSLPRGLLPSLNENQRVIPTEEISDFYLPLTKVSFIAVPSSFYLTLSMSPEERQRISRQLPENCAVKIPLVPFSAEKVQARGTGDRFLGLLFDEESVAFYMTVDEAKRRGVIGENGETLTVYPPMAMRHIISQIYRPSLQKNHPNFVTSESLLENEPFQSELKFDEFLSVVTRQTRTLSQVRPFTPVPQTSPGSPPVSRVDPQVAQHFNRTSTLPVLVGGVRLPPKSDTVRSIVANTSSSFEPATRKISFGEKCSFQRYRSFLLSNDFASHDGKIWIIAFPKLEKQNAKIGTTFCFTLTVYSYSAKPRYVTFSSTLFKLSFEDLLSIKEILTPDCFPMTMSLPHTDIDNTAAQIHTLVRSILYILVSSSVGYKVPLSPEERRILGYRPTRVLRSIEYYTVDPVTATIWVSTFYCEIILSLFRNGKTTIIENLRIFQPSLSHIFHSCTRNLVLSGQTTDGNNRNDEVLNVVLRPPCHFPCNQRTGAVSPPRVILAKLPYKGGHGLNEYQSMLSDTESAPPDSLQKTPHRGKSRLPIHSIQFEVLRSLQPPGIRFWHFPISSR